MQHDDLIEAMVQVEDALDNAKLALTSVEVGWAPGDYSPAMELRADKATHDLEDAIGSLKGARLQLRRALDLVMGEGPRRAKEPVFEFPFEPIGGNGILDLEDID